MRSRHCGELNRGLENLEKFQKDLILFVRICRLCVLLRGLQNLESPFGKVLILFVRNRHCGNLNRGLQNLETPERETDCHFLHRAKSNIKSTPEVCDPLDSRGRFKSPLDTKFYPK